jgi:hypothetical protein
MGITIAGVLSMDRKEMMTGEEIHEFGVQIVCERMAGEGFEILGANPSPTMIPQIVARKDGRLCFVIVRTDLYPNKGRLAGDKEFFYILEHAERNEALCYFAGVGICNAVAVETGDGRAMGTAVRDQGFYVDFDGLKLLTTFDRIAVADGNQLKGAEMCDAPGGSKVGILKKFGNALMNR